MLVAVKRLREIKCFKFLFKSCGAGFIANVNIATHRTLGRGCIRGGRQRN